MLVFDKIVKKMLTKWWKILFKKDIFEIIDPEQKPEFQNKLDKVIYRLKSLWIIIPIKSGVYIIPSEEDKKLNKIDLIEKYYLKLLKKYITYYVWSEYFISGQKSLEFHLKNYEIPEKIFIINRNLNKKIKIWNYEIIFKTISAKDKKNKKINFYNFLKKYLDKKNIENIEFKISCLELSLLESCLVWDTENWIDFGLINKAIKKYHSILNKNIFYDIADYKYIMSVNRLKEISKNIDRDLYEVFLDIIKKNWWLFIGEWLRWF